MLRTTLSHTLLFFTGAASGLFHDVMAAAAITKAGIYNILVIMIA